MDAEALYDLSPDSTEHGSGRSAARCTESMQVYVNTLPGRVLAPPPTRNGDERGGLVSLFELELDRSADEHPSHVVRASVCFGEGSGPQDDAGFERQPDPCGATYVFLDL